MPVHRHKHNGLIYDYHTSHRRPRVLLGVYQIGTPGARHRWDRWTGADGNGPPNNPDLAFCNGPRDTSPRHNSSPSYGGEYDPDCPECWLGFAHTTHRHQASVQLVRRGITTTRKERTQ